MNIAQMQQEITTKYTKHAADIMEGASFAYMNHMLEALKAKGEDPTEYEVVIVRDEYPKHTEDGFRIDSHIRLVRVADIPKAEVGENNE